MDEAGLKSAVGFARWCSLGGWKAYAWF